MLSTLFLLQVKDVDDLMLLYFLIFFKMAAASFYFTTEMSLLPKILAGDKLQKANELHSIIWSFSYTLGMAISGFVVYSVGVYIAFIFDTIMFFIAFILLFPLSINIKSCASKENLFVMMQQTFFYLKATPQALYLMVVHAFVGLTAFDALVALMVERYYASFIATSLALGLLHSSRAIGLVFGPLVLGKWINNQRFFYLFIAQGFAIWLWAYMMNSFYLSLVASICVGFFTTTLWSYSYTLLQKNIDKNYYGRIVAYNDMLFLSTAVLTSFMIGFLAEENFSLEMITVWLGSGFFIGAVFYKWVIAKENIKEIG
jgi:hypothetical protein